MKPLELTVYPKMGSVYYDDEAHCTWSETMVYGLSVEKRLTDAELAAEFEAARCDYLLSEKTGHFWAPLGETWPSDHESAGRRASTILRFATADHYDEAPSPSPAGPETKGTQQ